MAQFDLPVLRIDEHDDATREPDAKVCGEEVRAVVKEERDPVARFDSPRAQRARECLRPLPQPCICVRLPLKDDTCLLRCLLGIAAGTPQRSMQVS